MGSWGRDLFEGVRGGLFHDRLGWGGNNFCLVGIRVVDGGRRRVERGASCAADRFGHGSGWGTDLDDLLDLDDFPDGVHALGRLGWLGGLGWLGLHGGGHGDRGHHANAGLGGGFHHGHGGMRDGDRGYIDGHRAHGPEGRGGMHHAGRHGGGDFCGIVGILHGHADDRDVVLAARLECQSDEFGAGIRQGWRFGDCLTDQVVRHEIAQSIRTHHVDIPGLAGDFLNVHLHFVLEADGSQNDIFVCEVRRVLGFEFALVDEVVEQRVIAAHLFDFALSDAVDSGIADMRQDEVVGRVVDCGDGGAHAFH